MRKEVSKKSFAANPFSQIYLKLNSEKYLQCDVETLKKMNVTKIVGSDNIVLVQNKDRFEAKSFCQVNRKQLCKHKRKIKPSGISFGFD